jgi:hypothetical protein
MNLKHLEVLGATLLLSSLSVAIAYPLKANTANEIDRNSSLEIKERQGLYLSQALGHKDYPGATEKQWSDFQVGTIVSIVGDIAFVSLEDGTQFRQMGFDSRGRVRPGSQVLVEEKDGEYQVVDVAHPYWIGKLEAEQGYDISADSQQEPLQARTEAIRQSSKQTTTTEDITVETQTPAAQTPSGMGGEAPPPVEPVPAMW